MSSAAALYLDPATASDYVFPGDWIAHSQMWLSWQSEDHKQGQSVHVPQLQMIAAFHGHQKVALLVQDEQEETMVRHLAAQEHVPLEHVTFHRVPHTGLWARDMGPQFSRSLSSGKLAIVDWGFNQWGHEEPSDHDSALNATVHQILSHTLSVPMIPVATENNCKMIHEGGSVAHNGAGLMVAVESVAMQRNLGPQRFCKGATPASDPASKTSYRLSNEWDSCRERLTTEYRRSLGVTDLVWLPTGVYEDEGTFRGPIAKQFRVDTFEGKSISHAGVWTLYTTNGHADEFVKFIREDCVIVSETPIPEAPVDNSQLAALSHYIEMQNHERMDRCAAVLKQAKTAAGKPLTVLRIPAAPLLFITMQAGDPIYDYYHDFTHWDDGVTERFTGTILAVLPTSYVNFIATTDGSTPGCVLVANYWKEGRPLAWKTAQEAAWKVIQDAYPDRKLCGIDIEAINMGGGGIHCSSQQQPVEGSK